MKRTILLDTGPLVAFLSRRDRYHSWAVERLSEIEPPLYTCESVLSEACFRLQLQQGGREAVLELVQRGLIVVSFDLQSEAVPVKKLVARYANVPMDLADACLVRMSELHPDSILLTIDSDFGIYRKNGRYVIPTSMPEKR